MNFIKIVTVVNWIAIGLLFLLVGVMTVSSPVGGGDAAGRGIGKFFYQLSIILLMLLLVLNLLPYRWSRFTCFIIIMVPIVYFMIVPTIQDMYRGIMNTMVAKPWFEDKERQRMAEAIMNGKPDKLQKLLQSPVPLFGNKDYTYPLLSMAVGQATRNYTKTINENHMACVRLLLQAGASITSSDPMQEPVHFDAVSSYDARVLKLLLDHGADPNAPGIDYSCSQGNAVPIIFNSISDKACLLLLLEYGADPNATKPSDVNTPMPSIVCSF
jgi:hypothetical protein